MNLYIADLHFGHRNAIQFDHRPFLDAGEMDDALNAAACINNYTPASFIELVRNNKRFQGMEDTEDVKG